MKHILSKLSLNKKLGLTAVFLGAFALIAGSPYHNNVSIDVAELSLIVENKIDHITPEELAGWIIKGKADYRLVDINEEKVFNEYHIPGAENLQIAGLFNSGLLRNEKIVLYSDGGIHAAQAWFLLKAKEYKSVYTLFGGLEGWKEEILFPQIPDKMSFEDSLLFEKRKEVSKYFGGVPQSAGQSGSDLTPAKTMPKLQMPSGSNTGGTSKKKKKEGC